MRTGHIAATLASYGLAHALVDAVCAAVLFSAFRDARIAVASVLLAVLLYDTLAFAVQPFVGLALDAGGWTRGAAVAGALATAAAMPIALLPSGAFPAVVLAGVGNAVFHVGGGIVGFRATPGRALGPGVFVAPGAAGLTLGTVIGRGEGAVWPLAAALLTATALVAVAPLPSASPHRRTGSSPRPLSAVWLLLFVVAARSYVGLAVALPWKSALPLLAALTTAVVLGKALGGWAADRWGRAAVGVGALVLSAPLLAVGPGSAVAGIAGMLLFNMTMPVTLVAVADHLPGREGFAFGLTCLALAVGAFPVVSGLAVPLSVPALAVLASASAAALFLALRPPVATPVRSAERRAA